jgi:hypothetical protein
VTICLMDCKSKCGISGAGPLTDLAVHYFSAMHLCIGSGNLIRIDILVASEANKE